MKTTELNNYKQNYRRANSSSRRNKVFNKAMLNLSESEMKNFIAWQTKYSSTI